MIKLLVDAGRIPEAAFFARSHCPEQIPRILALWKADLKTVNEQVRSAPAFSQLHRLQGTSFSTCFWIDLKRVGLTKEEAEERGIKVKVGRIPMAINARYIAETPDETGFCKVVLEADTRKLLGVHMVGGACSEMIFGATAMLETELREEEIEEIVFPHPTTSEIIKDVFMAVR